jgi:hypothetical protein
VSEAADGSVRPDQVPKHEMLAADRRASRHRVLVEASASGAPEKHPVLVVGGDLSDVTEEAVLVICTVIAAELQLWTPRDHAPMFARRPARASARRPTCRSVPTCSRDSTTDRPTLAAMGDELSRLLPLIESEPDLPGVAELLAQLRLATEPHATIADVPAGTVKTIYRRRAKRGVSKAVAGDLQALSDRLESLADDDLVAGGVVYAGEFDAYVFADLARQQLLGCLLFPKGRLCD